MTMRPATCLRLLLAIGTGALLVACSFSLIEKGTAPAIYDIPTTDMPQAAGPQVAWQLTVEEPGASRELNTDRIVVRSGEAEIKYYGGVRWTDRAPRLVQLRLAESFDRSGRIVGVARGALGIRTDYKLLGELRAFEVLTGADRARATVSVALNLQLVQQSSSTIVATKLIDEHAPADGRSITSVASAFGAALDKAIAAGVAWTLAAGEADYRAR